MPIPFFLLSLMSDHIFNLGYTVSVILCNDIRMSFPWNNNLTCGELVTILWTHVQYVHMYTIRSQSDLFVFCRHMLVIVRSQLYINIHGCAEQKFITSSEWVHIHKIVILGPVQGEHECEQIFFCFSYINILDETIY
jgi:hypothetical protein